MGIMFLILSFESGAKAEGILLAAGSDRLRVILRELNDTVELQLVEGRWVSEDGDPVEIESMICAGEGEVRPAPLTRTAGN